MDSCQLIRKETKMEVVHFNQRQLAARWAISEAALERWRCEGIGPPEFDTKSRYSVLSVLPPQSNQALTAPIRNCL